MSSEAVDHNGQVEAVREAFEREFGRFDRFRAGASPKLARGQRVEGVRDARSEVRTALERAQRFLGLASLLSVVLASVAVALAARRFSQRQVDSAAMMRCLGASQGKIFALHAWQFAALGLAACVLGSLVGSLTAAGFDAAVLVPAS